MDKDLLFRLDVQEQITFSLIAEGHIRDVVTRALIATHPQPAVAKAAFQLLLSASESALPDGGFSAGLPPEVIRHMQTDMDQAAAKWLGFFPAQPLMPDTPKAG